MAANVMLPTGKASSFVNSSQSVDLVHVVMPFMRSFLDDEGRLKQLACTVKKIYREAIQQDLGHDTEYGLPLPANK